MALPFLPGNSFSTNVGKDKFHKSHHFDSKNQVSYLFGEDKPGIGGEALQCQKLKAPFSVYPRGEGSDLPAWVAFDRQVLCFDAYFQEAVHEKREEQYRVRECKVYFYLEDDSIQVIEPRNKNSGIPQGTLIRRHRVPKPPPHDDKYYRVEDFNVGEEINLYSRVFKLTGADPFTINFLTKLGVRVASSESAPADPYTKYRKAMDESMQAQRPYEKHDTLKQFLDHDRHVLRFYCHWDDTDSLFGDARDMVLHYFLADDTLEIREVIPPNSGRDAAAVFLRRGKLPKISGALAQPGVMTDRTVLNVFGPMGHGGRYILDSLKTGAVHTEYYTDADLRIGNFIDVLGRKFQICDADEFTKEYYRTKYGIESFASVNKGKGEPMRQTKQVPPYNGFGGEEDSACSCEGLVPKPPRRDFIKFMEKDRHGLESNVLRFLARMETDKPIDKSRRFIVSYFLSDDTMKVFEPPIRNSGVQGGKFLERGRVKKPDQPRYGTENPEYYTVKDLYVGANIAVNCFNFVLIDADEYAFRYMELNFEKFPVADINAVLRKLAPKARQNSQEVRHYLATNDPENSGFILYEQFHSLVNKLAGERLSEHEIMTVARYYSDHIEDKPVEIGAVVNMIQDHLRKHNFTEFAQLSQYFLHYDIHRKQELPMDDARRILRAQKVPLPNDGITKLLTMMEENGNIKYDVLMYHLNWRDFPAAPARSAITTESDWAGTKAAVQVDRVRYAELMNDLVGGAEC